MRLAVLAFITIGAVACRGSSERSDGATPTAAAASGPPTATAATASATSVASEKPALPTVSVAIFVEEKLEECVDFAVEGEPAKVQEMTEKFSSRAAKDKGQIRLRKPCAEQFADRTALATCTLTPKERDGVRVKAVSRYYNVATTSDSDSYMKDCLSMGGDWQVNADKSEAARERLRQRTKDILRDTK